MVRLETRVTDIPPGVCWCLLRTPVSKKPMSPSSTLTMRPYLLEVLLAINITILGPKLLTNDPLQETFEPYLSQSSSFIGNSLWERSHAVLRAEMPCLWLPSTNWRTGGAIQSVTVIHFFFCFVVPL